MKDLLSSVKSAHKTLITLGALDVNKCLLNIKNELINNNHSFFFAINFHICYKAVGAA